MFGNRTLIKDFRTYPGVQVNAFATPFGQIYLTDALVQRYHNNISLLIGVSAHEATHFICEHSVIEMWQDAEKERKNAILGGIATGLYMGSMAASGAITASGGGYVSQSYWENLSNNMIKGGLMIDESFRRDAFYFKYKYSRSQEIESDIVAYRFCESFGISGYSYIMALQLLQENAIYLRAGDTADHPTPQYRVLLLKYLYAKEHPKRVNAVTDTKTSFNIGNNLYLKKKLKSASDFVYHGNPKCTTGLVSVDLEDIKSDGINDTNLCSKCLSHEQQQLILKGLDNQ